MSKGTMVPFVKWVGGKRQLAKQLVERLPKSIKTYYEPFIGGGAFMYELVNTNKVTDVIFNDLNKELIDTYKAIRKDVFRVREYLLLMEMGHHVLPGKDDNGKPMRISPFYNAIRSIDQVKEFDGRALNIQDSIFLRAARFIFLNKNTFNGLYRVNQSGFFNSPSKHKEAQVTFDWENLLSISKFLKTVPLTNIKCGTFDKSVINSKKGDFVYFDPPYDYEDRTKGFDAYQKGGFGILGTQRLSVLCRELDKRGVNWMVSNHDTKLIRELYHGFNIAVVKAKRMVGGKGASRKDVNEVVITNYAY